MIVTCESCETRFKLSLEGIPSGRRVKVRCSRCNNSFHINSPHSDPPKPPPPPVQIEDTPAAGPEEDFSFEEDSDLENPEFLYEPESEQPPGDESGVFGHGPGDDFDLAGAPAVEPELASQVNGRIDEFLTEDEPEILQQPGVDPAALAPIEEADEAAEDPMSSWDPFGAGESGPPPLEQEPIPIFGSEEHPAEESQEQLEPLVVAPKAQGPRRLAKVRDVFVSLIATLVAVALSAGGVRALRVHAIEPIPGPPMTRGVGWVATDVEAFHLRNVDGERVLVVRGKLSSDGSTPLPTVQATLLDAWGEPVGASVPGFLSRLERTELVPSELSRHLATRPRSRAGDKASGFTVLIADPSVDARRFRVELLSGP